MSEHQLRSNSAQQQKCVRPLNMLRHQCCRKTVVLNDRFSVSWDDIIVEDIDADDYADIVIPAATYGPSEGRAYIYWGKASAEEREHLSASDRVVYGVIARS